MSPHNPVRLDRLNEPEPDFAVLRPRADNYRTGERPGPGDVLLLVEVGDSSIRYDRCIKLPLYARYGIPEYWIVDLTRRQLDVHRSPAGEGYASVQTFGENDRIALAAAPDIVVPLSRVFD